jgi:hypothetical protein
VITWADFADFLRNFNGRNVHIPPVTELNGLYLYIQKWMTHKHKQRVGAKDWMGGDYLRFKGIWGTKDKSIICYSEFNIRSLPLLVILVP